MLDKSTVLRTLHARMKLTRSPRLQAQSSVDEKTKEEVSERQNESPTNEDQDQSIAKGGVACPFPWRLHDMLNAVEEEGLTDIVSWQPHGHSFTVYNAKEFVDKIMVRCVRFATLCFAYQFG